MSKINNSIWFWQQMVTPHMAALASALATRGFKVIYVANEILSKKRSNQGWEKSKLEKAKLLLARSKDDVIRYALYAPKNSIHLCQGLRGNGLIKYAQKVIRKRNLSHWVMVETIDDIGLLGTIKRIVYRLLFFYWYKKITGVLAIGRNTPEWFIARGIDRNRIYPFAYFLKEPKTKRLLKLSIKKKLPFKFVFIGELIKLKKVDLLIKSIAALKSKEIELWIVGSGPEEKYLKSLANLLLSKIKVKWLGVVPNKEIPNIIYQANCLVLPSRHDGWGAVVSESLMVGTPVICSDKCGSSVVVQASGVGGVFTANNQQSLIVSLRTQLRKGHLSTKERKKIIEWSKCLNATSGAKYLESILNLNNHKVNLIKLPWN